MCAFDWSRNRFEALFDFYPPGKYVPPPGCRVNHWSQADVLAFDWLKLKCAVAAPIRLLASATVGYAHPGWAVSASFRRF